MVNFLDRIFGNLSEQEDLPNIKLGRFTDVHKSKAQKESFKQAHQQFDKEEYLESFNNFLDYIDDPYENNIEKKHQDNKIVFQIYQGSKCVEGYINTERIYAEAKIVQTNGYSIGYLRKMVANNYFLHYGGYAIDSQDALVIQFESATKDTPPTKLYRALKELAVNADKQDDLLLNEFQSLTPINQGHIRPIPDKEKEVKYEFLVSAIENKLALIKDLRISPDKKAGAISYILLDLVYRLDYLTSPEGKSMETFESLHRKYFGDSVLSAGRKNIDLIKKINKLKELDKDSFLKELYHVSSTFGITPPAPVSKIIDFINPEIAYINWYIQNTQEEVALSVCGYIIGSLLFNYSTPKPIHQLLHLYYQILEPDFFGQFNLDLCLLNNDTCELNKSKIVAKIEDIRKSNKNDFAQCKIDHSVLNYSSLPRFCRSYILMLRSIRLETKDELIN